MTAKWPLMDRFRAAELAKQACSWAVEYWRLEMPFAAAHESVSVQVFGRRDDGLTTDCGGRRPKSAKARSRGKLGTGGVTGYGDLMAAPISMLDVTPTGRGRGICTQARLEAWNRHLGKRLERINERTARRA
jgi:hypothetical protein